jgi:hypothetical protein
LIAAASKKDKASAILAQGVTILKKLYQIGNDNIKVRISVQLLRKPQSMNGLNHLDSI